MVSLATLGLSAAAGAACAGHTHLALIVAGTAAVVMIGLACASRRGVMFLTLTLVASTFVTKFKFAVAGAHLRPEDIIVLPLLLSLVACRAGERPDVVQRRALVSAATHPASLLLLAYVGWGLVASRLFSPQFAPSMRIDIWLALDWLIMVSVVAGFSSTSELEKSGWRLAVAALAIADVLYVVGPSLGGFGIQLAQSTFAGTKSASGLAFEANLLGGAAAVWLFLALSRPDGVTVKSSSVGRLIALLVVAAALVLSFTRAAIGGLFLGLVIWGLVDGGAAWRRIARRVVPGVLVAAIFLALVPSVGGPVADKLGHIFSLSSGTGAVRVGTVQSALPDLGHMNWVLGLGLNSYGQRHGIVLDAGQELTGYLGAFPLEVLYDTGIVGILLLVGAWAATRPWLSERPGRALGLTVVFLVCSLTTSPFWLGSSWVLIALAVSGDLARSTTSVAAG